MLEAAVGQLLVVVELLAQQAEVVEQAGQIKT